MFNIFSSLSPSLCLIVPMFWIVTSAAIWVIYFPCDNSIQSNPIQPNPTQPNPIQSKPSQAKPIQSIKFILLCKPYIITMITSDSFVFPGNVNLVFPSLLMLNQNRLNLCSSLFRLTLMQFIVHGCTMHVVFSYARAEHNNVANSAQLLVVLSSTD